MKHLEYRIKSGEKGRRHAAILERFELNERNYKMLNRKV